MTLRTATQGKTYTVASVETGDGELEAFLFSLGCYRGEPITVAIRQRSSMIVLIKDGRYSMDMAIADAISVCEA